MIFESNGFKCDVQVYRASDGIAVRFYDKSMEQDEEELVNYVLVHQAFGYLSLKFIGNSGDGLISGFLNASVFKTGRDEDAIELLQSLADRPLGYIPHKVSLVREIETIEYNGEF